MRKLLVAMLALAACGDDDTPDYHDSCADNCARAHSCNSSIDADDCRTRCENNWESVGPQLSSAYLDGIHDCVQELDCSQFLVSSITGSCANEARANLAPSAAAKDLCERVVDSFQQCLGLKVDSVGCLDNSKIFADGALHKAAQCDDQPCDQRLNCVRDALGADINK